MSSRTPVLHFTHQDNLGRILEQGGLLCDSAVQSSGLNRRNIAYNSIKQQRASTVVEVPPGGTLDHYVPFYFGPRSPMMLTYKNGNVTGKAEDVSQLVYFVTHAEDVAASGLRFVFTDGHPVVEPRFFSNDLADLGEVDLPLMREKLWFDTNAYPDRKRRRQAEFLVWRKMPIAHVSYLATMTEPRRAELLEVLQSHGIEMACKVCPNWYYQ